MAEGVIREQNRLSDTDQDNKLVSLSDHRARKQPQPAHQKTPQIITFDRKELNTILRVYGFKVADGEWRDYAIDHLKEKAVFSIYRRSSEMPLYRVEKNPKLARKQGQFAILSATGQILKRGHDLATVLRFLEKKPKLVEV
ncbi:MAG: DUF2794 domain-containing protein [Pseudomonadota bacterium]